MLFENFFTAIRLSQFKQVYVTKNISVLLRMDGLISLKKRYFIVSILKSVLMCKFSQSSNKGLIKLIIESALSEDISLSKENIPISMFILDKRSFMNMLL